MRSILCLRGQPIRWVRAVLVVMLGSCITGIPAMPQADVSNWPDCLNSEPGAEPFNSKNCKGDPLEVSKDNFVIRTEQMFELPSDEISFIGCETAPFNASMTIIDPPVHFQILYRVKRNSDLRYYIAPILHEIGHVYQLRKAGSPKELGKSLHNSIERTELGADYLAGIAARKLGLNVDVAAQSIFMVGSFRSGELGSHGNAAQRTGAFRLGYFYQHPNAPVSEQYLDFQNNRFAEVRNM